MANLRNGLIDGWRGLSVLLVVLGHFVAFRYSSAGPLVPVHELIHGGQWVELIRNVGFRIIAPIGEIGVQFFFVISGYLITGLLDAEEKLNGQINLTAFYVRRIFRIMPAFYFYFITIWALRTWGLVKLDNAAFARSGLYLCNVSGFKCSWWLAHTWSLSVEEQFYIVWPIAFILLRRLRLLGILFIQSALVIGSFFTHDFVSFACIGAGSVLALSGQARDWILKYSTKWTVTAAAAFLFIQPLFPVGAFLNGAFNIATPLLSIVAFYPSIHSIGPLNWILASKLVQKIGLISYSLYLWQQIGTAPEIWNETMTGAATLYSTYPMLTWFFVIPAIASFVLLEKPLQIVGQEISRRLMKRTTLARRPESIF